MFQGLGGVQGAFEIIVGVRCMCEGVRGVGVCLRA